MQNLNRRRFLQAGAGMAGVLGMSAWSPAAAPPGTAPPASPSGSSWEMQLGVVTGVGENPDENIRRVKELGLPTCQAMPKNYDKASATKLREALLRHNIKATSILALGPGAYIWNFYEGPITIGLVPRAQRAARIAKLKAACDVAVVTGTGAVHTHCGFIPEDPNNELYLETVEAIREVARYCRDAGREFWMETGQETPVVLLRVIKDVGLDNIFINLDTANLILYGKANPLDSLDVIGKYVHGLHAKDGLYPTDPVHLGEEVPIGKGKVDFPRIIARLKELNFHGALTIEREISGPKQVEDIKAAKRYLEQLIWPGGAKPA